MRQPSRPSGDAMPISAGSGRPRGSVPQVGEDIAHDPVSDLDRLRAGDWVVPLDVSPFPVLAGPVRRNAPRRTSPHAWRGLRPRLGQIRLDLSWLSRSVPVLAGHHHRSHARVEDASAPARTPAWAAFPPAWTIGRRAHISADSAMGMQLGSRAYSAISSIIGVSHVVRMLTECGRPKIAPDPWEQTCCGEASGG